MRDRTSRAVNWAIHKLEDESTLNTPILYYFIAPSIATFVTYLLSQYLYSKIIDFYGGPVQIDLGNPLGFLQLFGTIERFKNSPTMFLDWSSFLGWLKAGNVFIRIFPFVAFGAAVGSILLIPSTKRKRIVGVDKISCAVRANCVALITVIVMVALFFMNPFSEKLSEQALVEGIALYWSQIFAGVGAFILSQQLLFKINPADSKLVETVQRGLEKTASEEDVYIHKPNLGGHRKSAEEEGEEEIFIPKPQQTAQSYMADTESAVVSEQDRVIDEIHRIYGIRQTSRRQGKEEPYIPKPGNTDY
jgi:hypothetical protein